MLKHATSSVSFHKADSRSDCRTGNFRPMTDTNISHASLMKMDRYRDLSLTKDGPETALRLYQFMMRLRLCEEALIREYRPAHEMRCPVHFCLGQEAVPAAAS